MAASSSRNTNTQAGQLTRPCLAAPFEFTVRLTFKPKVAAEDIDEIADALKLLGLCGGLGSRSRRGWGSVTLIRLERKEETWWAPQTFEKYEVEIRKIIDGHNNSQTAANGLPEWTAFAARQSRIVLLQDKAHSPLETLAKMGKDFVFFRSWGSSKTTPPYAFMGCLTEKNFKFDHDLFKQINDRDRNTEHPQRIVFGLPQNYGPAAQDKVIPADSGPEKDWLTRRASPLFFHVHQVAADDPPIGVLTYLPARFLPAKKNAVKFGGAPVELVDDDTGDFWKPAEDFLNRILSADRKHPAPLKPSKVEFIKTLEVRL